MPEGTGVLCDFDWFLSSCSGTPSSSIQQGPETMRLLVGLVLPSETCLRRPTILLQVQHGQFKRPS